LRDLGYVEGKNLTIEFRWAEGKHERLPDLAAELVRLKVDVIVTQGTPGALAAKQATATIPIVMAVVADPVATGLVASLARPGGNVTGLSWVSHEVSAKRLELLRDAFPRTKRVAVLINPNNASNPPILQAMELAARSLKLEISKFEARGPEEFDSAFTAMATKRVDAVTIIDDAVLIANAKAIANLAAKKRLPLMAFNETVEAGGLMAYGANFPDAPRSAQKARTLIEAVTGWLDANVLPDEQPEEGWGHYIVENAGDGIVPATTEVFTELLYALDGLSESDQGFDRYLSQITPMGKDLALAESPGVRIMTMGGAKGLTVRATIIAGLEEGLVPRPDCELGEERRLLYVAMTRAKEFLFCVWARRRTGPTARMGAPRVQMRRRPCSFLDGGPVSSTDGAGYIARRWP